MRLWLSIGVLAGVIGIVRKILQIFVWHFIQHAFLLMEGVPNIVLQRSVLIAFPKGLRQSTVQHFQKLPLREKEGEHALGDITKSVRVLRTPLLNSCKAELHTLKRLADLIPEDPVCCDKDLIVSTPRPRLRVAVSVQGPHPSDGDRGLPCATAADKQNGALDAVAAAYDAIAVNKGVLALIWNERKLGKRHAG